MIDRMIDWFNFLLEITAAVWPCLW